jgi:hypothetical protein
MRWAIKNEDNDKAYQDDEFTNEDWQLTDFMKKVGLLYPIDNEGNPMGENLQTLDKRIAFRIKKV